MNYLENVKLIPLKKSMESYFLRIGVMKRKVYFVNLIFNHRH